MIRAADIAAHPREWSGSAAQLTRSDVTDIPSRSRFVACDTIAPQRSPPGLRGIIVVSNL
jgi:hypothetical protein